MRGSPPKWRARTEPLAGLALFDTHLGRCGLAFDGGSILATALPETDPARTLAGLARRAGGGEEAEMPADIARAAARIAAALDGGADELADLPLAWPRVGAFDAGVLRLTAAIPRGETRLYGDLARDLGDIGLARAVGQALGRNPWPIVVPCHRVLGGGGRIGGFSAPGGRATKLALLRLEGAAAAERLPLFAHSS